MITFHLAFPRMHNHLHRIKVVGNTESSHADATRGEKKPAQGHWLQFIPVGISHANTRVNVR